MNPAPVKHAGDDVYPSLFPGQLAARTKWVCRKRLRREGGDRNTLDGRQGEGEIIFLAVRQRLGGPRTNRVALDLSRSESALTTSPARYVIHAQGRRQRKRKQCRVSRPSSSPLFAHPLSTLGDLRAHVLRKRGDVRERTRVIGVTPVCPTPRGFVHQRILCAPLHIVQRETLFCFCFFFQSGISPTMRMPTSLSQQPRARGEKDHEVTVIV
jgi:hypothetical protein